MHTFYLHLPWKINEEEYNCSSRSYSEWKSRGSVNIAQGIYFTVSGTIFMVLYALCLVGMYRGRLLKNSCYKFMFYNGFADIADLALTSYYTSYFHFTGAVFCSAVVPEWIVGHLVYSLWFGASFNCIVLAFNRLVEMIPSAGFLRFLYKGKFLYMWMVISVSYMIVVWFVLRPIPFNTSVSAFLGTPMIGDPQWEYEHYTSTYLIFHNCTVAAVVLLIYPFLGFYVRKASGHGVDNLQMQIFIQVLFVCATTSTAAWLYVLIEFIEVPRGIIITAHVLWHLSHGMHGITYLCFNAQVRKEVFAMFFKTNKKVSHAITTSNTGV